MSQFSTILKFLSLSILAGIPSGQAIDILNVPGSDGTPFFQLYLYNPGEHPEAAPEKDGSDFTLNDREKAAIIDGLSYWASILAPKAKNQAPLNIAIVTEGEYDDNASATSDYLPNGYTMLSSALTGNPPLGDPELDGALALITIDHAQYFNGEWNTSPMPSFPENGEKADLPSTLLHEMMHALGLARDIDANSDNTLFSFTGKSLWNAGLRDIYGHAAQDGMVITEKGSKEDDGTAFVTNGKLSHVGVYFTGNHVEEVLQGALLAWPDDSTEDRVAGLPVNGWEFVWDKETGKIDYYFPEFSHIELQNSLMSHQGYRNWNILMEAELAVMQDCGLELDRRNFYGNSLYNDGLTYINKNPYYARNAEGTGWKEGQYNPTTYGTGFHIYGSHNTIRQTADLLSSGKWGIGIRMDGSGNTLTIDPNVRVHANGTEGNALLVAYGRNHHIVHRGSLQALGGKGISARFDFGSNEMGDKEEWRGSWMRSKWLNDEESWTQGPLLDSLKGALVDSFDVTGSLAGSKAAIFISNNAYVDQINIMAGASVSGDIISEWDWNNDNLQAVSSDRLITKLTFGKMADALGQAMDQPDASFSMRYDGKISGPTGIAMRVAGGTLSYNGSADILSVVVEHGATLTGNGTYCVDELIENKGTLSPGNSIGTVNIQGNFVQTETGRLLMELNDSGQHDLIAIDGNAQIEGTLELALQRGYYRDSFSVTPLEVTGDFLPDYTLVCDPMSPTLTVTTRQESTTGHHGIVVTTNRAANAYSQYAEVSSSSARETGRALDHIAAASPEKMRSLFGALDFSAQDGSDIRFALPRLSADAYGATALATLDMQRMLSDTVFSGTKTYINSGQGNYLFIQPYTNGNDQPGSIGYKSYNIGTLVGIRRQTSEKLHYGGHAVFNYLNMRGDTNGKLEGNSFMLGGQLEYAPQPEGFKLALLGRAGIDQMRMKRQIAFNGYDASHSADWTGFSGTIRLQGSYDKDLGSVIARSLASLDYGLATRPSCTENGSEASRLALGSNAYQSLRTRLGGQIITSPITISGQSSWLAKASATWNHEFMNRAGTTNTAFAASNYGFSNKVKFPGRDSIALEAGVALGINQAISLQLNAGSELYMHGDESLYGNISLTWTF